jgi:murein L,D-transpeptidase YafK
MKTLVGLLLCIIFLTNVSFERIANGDDYYVVVTKSTYEMAIYKSNGTWIATYPVVFGNKDLGDKLYEGDRRTPEGTYHIISKRPHAKWCDFFQLDYPNQENIQKFNERKAKGIIPYNARIGGAIGIHGTWPNEDFAVDGMQNWTMGCISTKNEYIKELFYILPVGTKVIIRR